MMDIYTQDNLKVVLSPMPQFKNIQIQYDFGELINSDDFARQVSSRALMASIMEVSSKKNIDLMTISKLLEDMYGAEFGANLTKIGRTHHVQFNLSLVSDVFLDHSNQLEDGLNFLMEQIFNPLSDDGQFDKSTFEIEKNNLKTMLESRDENKAVYARRKLLENYFQDESLAVGVTGVSDAINELSSQLVYQSYLNMIDTNQATLVIAGNFDVNQAKQILIEIDHQYPKIVNFDYLYSQAIREETQIVQVQEVTQAKYNLAYNLRIDVNSDERFVAQVLNQILGGSPMSKLFVNVREKASLAYTVSSSFDMFSGLLIVQTGIDAENYAAAKKIIDEQLQAIQEGDFSEETVNQIKIALIDDRKVLRDSLSGQVGKLFMASFLNRSLTDQQYFEKIQNVNRQMIVELANRIVLQTEYLLTSQSDD